MKSNGQEALMEWELIAFCTGLPRCVLLIFQSETTNYGYINTIKARVCGRSRV
jgi:hypothetical protein